MQSTRGGVDCGGGCEAVPLCHCGDSVSWVKIAIVNRVVSGCIGVCGF